jgi:alpha-L-fucosidase
MKAIRWQDGKGDMVKRFTDSCRKHGLSAGIFTEASEDIHLKVHNYKVSKGSPLTQVEYDRMVTKELEELCTQYGPLCELWYDMREGPYTDPFRAIISKYQPNAVFYGPDYRWGGGREDGQVAYPCWATFSWVPLDRKLLRTGDMTSTNWCPARADAPLRYRNGSHYWYWHPNCEKGVATLSQLQQMYYGSVGRNAKLVIGLTPDRDGLIPAPDAARCKEFGDWLQKTFGGKPLAETAGKGREFTLEIPSDNQTPVTHLILQEAIQDGERVRKYVVEAEISLRPGQAGSWKQVGSGTCIGHKRIEKIEPCTARKFRLRITQAVGEPRLRAFSVR